jgi:hypothetical protein
MNRHIRSNAKSGRVRATRDHCPLQVEIFHEVLPFLPIGVAADVRSQFQA